MNRYPSVLQICELSHATHVSNECRDFFAQSALPYQRTKRRIGSYKRKRALIQNVESANIGMFESFNRGGGVFHGTVL